MSAESPKAPTRGRSLENGLARVLTTLTLASAAVLLVGLAMQLIAAAGSVWMLEPFARRQAEDLSPGAILRGAASGDGRAVLHLGLLLLIATPVARVAFTLVVFALRRDWLFTVITGVVLTTLALAISGVLS